MKGKCKGLLFIALIGPFLPLFSSAQWLETTITVGSNPYALVYNMTNNKIYSANWGSYSVSVIDGETNSVITVIGVGDGPIAFTYNPQYNRVYVANYYGNSVSVIRDVMPWIEECTMFDASRSTFEIYPNPARTHFTVRLPHNANRSTVRIFDASGTLVISIEMTKPEAKVLLQGISSGIYFVQHDNNRTITKLVVTK